MEATKTAKTSAVNEVVILSYISKNPASTAYSIYSGSGYKFPIEDISRTLNQLTRSGLLSEQISERHSQVTGDSLIVRYSITAKGKETLDKIPARALTRGLRN